MKLLYRPLKMINESIDDYIARLAYHNGFSTTRKFKGCLDNLYFRTYGGSKNDQSSRATRAARRKIILELLTNRNLHESHLNHLKHIPQKYYGLSICNSCWSENPYIRSFWHLRQYDKCHIHRKPMNPNHKHTSWYHYSSIYSTRFKELDPSMVASTCSLYDHKDYCLPNIIFEIHLQEYVLKIIYDIGVFFEYAYLGKLKTEAAINASATLAGLPFNRRMERILSKRPKNTWLKYEVLPASHDL